MLTPNSSDSQSSKFIGIILTINLALMNIVYCSIVHASSIKPFTHYTSRFCLGIEHRIYTHEEKKKLFCIQNIRTRT